MSEKVKEQNEKLLIDIYKNLDMATWSIDLIDDEILNDDMLELVRKQKKMYEENKCQAMTLAETYNIDLKNINIMAKLGSLTSIKVGTFFDNSLSHIANKLMQGTSMGIIEIKKALNSYKNVDKEIEALGKRIYDLESKFYTSLQDFL